MTTSTELHPALREFAARSLVLLLVLLWTSEFAWAQVIEAKWLATATNPTRSAESGFGTAMAALGNDRLLIGASSENRGATSAGASYLFSAAGALQNTLTNPIPVAGDFFGSAVAALGTDRLIISAVGSDTGSPDSGVAYLLSTDGTLLTTFTNPTPQAEDGFGQAVTAVGKDRVLISAPGADTSVVDSGAAYLFTTSGLLLTTFLKPNPARGDSLGTAVAAVGGDRVLMSSAGGFDPPAVYLFSTNGTLLTVFTNPVPEGADFGVSVAALGSDRVVIGADGFGSGTQRAGAAYLFSTAGKLLTTFTNPAPVLDAGFGFSVASVGTDRVLIGSPNSLGGAPSSGLANLFTTNGTLLATLTSPEPVEFGNFGWVVAAVGSDRLAVAEQGGARSVHLFDLPYPQLSLTRNGSAVSLQWVTGETGLVLQQTGALGTEATWSKSTETVSINGPTNVVQLTLGSTNRFFRLGRP